jgi:hypothetical protein
MHITDTVSVRDKSARDFEPESSRRNVSMEEGNEYLYEGVK